MPEKDEGKLCEIKKAVKCSFKYTLPVLTGFIALGMAYGILMQQKGFNVLWSLFISATAFCGSMQYVLITLMTAGLHVWKRNVLLSIAVGTAVYMLLIRFVF